MAPKAPSEGTKVTLGQNAPTKNEAAGTVASDSLAAESYNQDGAFSHNTAGQPENLSHDQLKSSSGSSELTSTSTSTNAASYDEAAGKGRFAEMPNSYAGAAPTYVASQYTVDRAGPHGKNIHEGFDDAGMQDGLTKAMEAELGSKDDPARSAEYQFELKNNAKSRAAGPKEGGFTNETKYDALSRESDA